MQQPQNMQLDPNGFPMDPNGNYTLPAALLAQYPALAGLSWPDLPHGDPLDDDISGRSSFDASGSEYYEEEEGGYVSSGPGPQQYGGQFGQQQQQLQNTYNAGYSSDIGR